MSGTCGRPPSTAADRLDEEQRIQAAIDQALASAPKQVNPAQARIARQLRTRRITDDDQHRRRKAS